MSFLADVLFQWTSDGKTKSLSPYSPFGVKATWLNFFNVLYEYRFNPSNGCEFIPIGERKFPYTTNGNVAMKRLPVMSAASEQMVINSFRLTQISEYTAVFEFTEIQSLTCNPPVSFTVVYQPLRGSWIATEPKGKLLACLTINAEDAGLGPLSFFATTIDVAWQPVSPLQHEYCLCFQLCTIGGFALPSGKTEAMKYIQRNVSNNLQVQTETTTTTTAAVTGILPTMIPQSQVYRQ